MVLTYKPKLELYKHGFFVSSFDTMAELNGFLIEYKEKNGYTTEEMNNKVFSIVESKHAIFEG